MRQDGPRIPRGQASIARTAICHTVGTVRAARARHSAGARLANPLPNVMDDLAAAENAKQTAPRRPFLGPDAGQT